jgi:uncharacterized protein (TIGR02679 family)
MLHLHARLWYHGDFDWPGLVIANLVMRRMDARRWRMSTADYEGASRTNGPPLQAGSRVEASWDPQLAAMMERRGLAVHEEAVAEQMLQELQRRAL